VQTYDRVYEVYKVVGFAYGKTLFAIELITL